jgi:hypothetical protein
MGRLGSESSDSLSNASVNSGYVTEHRSFWRVCKDLLSSLYECGEHCRGTGGCFSLPVLAWMGREAWPVAAAPTTSACSCVLLP